MKKWFFSLRSKFILVILPLIAVPLLTSIALTYHLYSQSQQEQSSDFMHNIIIQVCQNLDRYTRELNRLTMMPLMSEEYLDIFRRRPQGVHPISTQEERLSISAFNVSLMLEHSEISSYTMFCLNGDIFSNAGPEAAALWDLRQEAFWMDIARAGEGSMVFLPPNKPAYFLREHDYMVSVARAIRDPITMQVLGFVKIDLSNDGFRDILYLDDNEHMLFYIYSASNQKIYPYAMEHAFIPRGKMLEIEGRDYLVSTGIAKESGLSVYMMYPYDVLQQKPREIAASMLQIAIAFLGVSCLLCVLFAVGITRPIRSLQESLLTYSRGELSERSTIHSGDEIGDLARGFNQMATRLQQLIEQQYQAELRRQEAEILVMQSQMNPHFLYNTLEAISMNALNHDDIATSDMVTKLGKMLRYTISIEKELVPLKREVQFVEDYLGLQIVRLGPRLAFSLQMDAALEDCLVPKLILQPFIENIIVHAVGAKTVHMTLHALAEDERLTIRIHDDGMGMTAETLQRVVARMHAQEAEPEKQGSVGIALRNVHQRISLRFGKAYGVQVESGSWGTRFCVTLPLMWKGEEGNAPDPAGRG